MNEPKERIMLHNRGLEPGFNWLAVLKDLAAGKPLTTQERVDLRRRAVSWSQCACSQLCGNAPKFGFSNIPKDKQLHEYGMDFTTAVLGECWEGAIKLFHLIEARVQKINEQEEENEAKRI